MVEFSVNSSVASVFDYVMSVAPVEGEFQLMTGFPPKPLDNPSLTIKAAGLKNAAVTQKIL